MARRRLARQHREQHGPVTGIDDPRKGGFTSRAFKLDGFEPAGVDLWRTTRMECQPRVAIRTADDARIPRRARRFAVRLQSQCRIGHDVDDRFGGRNSPTGDIYRRALEIVLAGNPSNFTGRVELRLTDLVRLGRAGGEGQLSASGLGPATLEQHPALEQART